MRWVLLAIAVVCVALTVGSIMLKTTSEDDVARESTDSVHADPLACRVFIEESPLRDALLREFWPEGAGNPDAGAASSLAFGLAAGMVRDPCTVDQYFVGDWGPSPNGRHELAARVRNRIHYAQSVSDLRFRTVQFGSEEDAFGEYLAGDWDGTLGDEFGVRRGNKVHLQARVDNPGTWIVYQFGTNEMAASGTYFAGDWNGDGKDTLAIRLGNKFHLQADPTPAELRAAVASPSRVLLGRTLGVLQFGSTGLEPACVGNWDRAGGDSFALWIGTEVHFQREPPIASFGASPVMGSVEFILRGMPPAPGLALFGARATGPLRAGFWTSATGWSVVLGGGHDFRFLSRLTDPAVAFRASFLPCTK